MATLNLGRIKPVFRGAYSGSTAYVVDDIVTHGNESFICIQAHGAGTQATSVTAYWTKLAAKGTDGTDVGTTITTQGDILFRDGSGLQRLASSGHGSKTLQMNSGATAPEWVTVAAPSVDFTKLTASTAFSNVTTLAIGDASWGTGYSMHLINLNLKRHSADTGGTFYFQFSEDDGSSYLTANCNSGVHHINTSTATMSSGYVSENSAESYLGGDGGRTTYGHCQIWIANLLSTEHKTYSSTYVRLNQDGSNRMVASHGAGHIGNSSGSDNAINLRWTGGEAFTGRYTVYGLKD